MLLFERRAEDSLAIAYFRIVCEIEQNIFRLDVSMHDFHTAIVLILLREILKVAEKLNQRLHDH